MKTSGFVCLVFVLTGSVIAMDQKRLGPEWTKTGEGWYRRPVEAKAWRAGDAAKSTTYVLTTSEAKGEITVIESDDGQRLTVLVRPREGALPEVVDSSRRVLKDPVPPPIPAPPPTDVGCSVERDEKGRPIKCTTTLGDYTYIDFNGDGKIDAILNPKTRSRQIIVGDRLVGVEDSLDALSPDRVARALDANRTEYVFKDGAWKAK